MRHSPAYVLLLSGAALLSSAFFLNDYYQTLVIVAIMLFAPFMDKQWKLADVHMESNLQLWSALIIISLVLILLKSPGYNIVLNQLLIAAIPEEWFFRAYLLNRLGVNIKANVISSLLFSVLHMVTRGWIIGVLVFIPSLLFGKIYQIRRDFVLVVLLHFTANLLYTQFIEYVPADMSGFLK